MKFNRRFGHILVFLFLFFSSLSVGFSDWVIAYQSNSLTPSEDTSFAPVAYISGDNSRKFSTVEKALEEANSLATSSSSKTVVVMPGTNPTITRDCTIGEYVTLVIPYDDTLADSYNFNSTGQSRLTTSADAEPSNLKNTVSISSGIVVSNYGSIKIAGQLSGGTGGGAFAGQTGGSYTQILMEDDSKIVSLGINSAIYCYGYIKESSSNNGSEVDVQNGVVYMPFVMRDFRGGNAMYGIYQEMEEYHISPFNQFEMRNIQSKIIFSYNSKLIVWANLYANNQHNQTTINMIGNDSIDGDYLIEMSNSEYSYLESKYNFNTEVNTVNLYGGAKSTILSMSLDTGIPIFGTVTVSTDGVYFPISYRFNINLLKNDNQPSTAKYDMPNYFKILPGGSLKVGVGAELTIDHLFVYEEFDDTSYSTPGKKYYTSSALAKIPGKLIVDGTLHANYLGGFVSTEHTGASVIVNSGNSATSYEAREITYTTIPLVGDIANGANLNSFTLNATFYSYRNGTLYSDYESTFIVGNTQYLSASDGDGYGFANGTKYTVSANKGDLPEGAEWKSGWSFTVKIDEETVLSLSDGDSDASYSSNNILLHSHIKIEGTELYDIALGESHNYSTNSYELHLTGSVDIVITPKYVLPVTKFTIVRKRAGTILYWWYPEFDLTIDGTTKPYSSSNSNIDVLKDFDNPSLYVGDSLSLKITSEDTDISSFSGVSKSSGPSSGKGTYNYLITDKVISLTVKRS
jgi:hypothetical protein